MTLDFTRSKRFTSRLEEVVPGGAHTYSKGRDQFPSDSPSGIVRGQRAKVWDADGNCFVDWSMGLTSVSLGHAHPEINRAVTEAIACGVNFQRPSRLELEVAEYFVDCVGTEMVKFARHGSSVTSAAVKLARAYTGRSIVAVPKEHPFFSFDDWFIGSTPTDWGVPEALKKYVVKFSYNDVASLEALFEAHPNELACVLMEPVKFDPPRNDFLQRVRKTCTDHGVVLIFDEMVTGLKFPFPGAGRYFDVEPDLSTWGKGIANGFSSAALTGCRDIMRIGGLEPEGERKLFLMSTTHGAESVGLAATKRTLELFRDGQIISQNWQKAETLWQALQEIINREGLEEYLTLSGYPGIFIAAINFHERGLETSLQTLFMQEMIQNGVLFQGLFFMTPSHGEEEIERTLAAFESSCEVIAKAIDARSVSGLLRGTPIKPVFRAVR